MRSIKLKLVIVVSILVVFIVSIASFLFVKEKKLELHQDIYMQARSFAELTADKVVDNYLTFWKSGGFVYFNRELVDIFAKNTDIDLIQVINYEGEILYDSGQDKDEPYVGESRRVEDKFLLERIQAKYSSVGLVGKERVIYLAKSLDGIYETLDSEGNEIKPVDSKEQVSNVIFPIKDKYAVFYGVSYRHLNDRIRKTTERILLLMAFGVLVGLAVSYLFASGLTAPIIQLTQGAEAISKGDFKKRIKVRSKDEIGRLADTFNKMAEHLDKSTKAMLYKQRVTKELELAARIQRELLPSQVPKVEGIEIAAGLIPAEEIGGDCFDFIPIDKDNILVYVGDVTGHGVPSGLVVAIANAVVYSFARSKTVKDVLVNTNHILRQKTSPNMFLTMIMVKWNNLAKRLTYVSAGHERMLFYSIDEKKVHSAPGGGMALGMLPDISTLLEEREVKMKTGDLLVLYSDGITEAKNVGNEEFGVERLKRILRDCGMMQSAEAVKNAILSEVKQFIGSIKQADDVTLVVIRRK